MNEIQIIQSQLATERAHFAEVAETCARAQTHGELLTACRQYFELAVTRFEPPQARALAAELAAGPSAAFLAAFAAVCRDHFAQLDALRARNPPVTQWRAVSRIDADSIVAERARYARVKAAIPT